MQSLRYCFQLRCRWQEACRLSTDHNLSGLSSWLHHQQTCAVESIPVRLLEAGHVFRISVPYRYDLSGPIDGKCNRHNGVWYRLACFIHHVDHHVAHVVSTRVELTPVGGENQFAGFTRRAECDLSLIHISEPTRQAEISYA